MISGAVSQGKRKGSWVVAYRGASEYELGSMGSNSSSFRLAAVEVRSRVRSSTGAQGVPCHRALPSPEVEPVVARPQALALTRGQVRVSLHCGPLVPPRPASPQLTLLALGVGSQLLPAMVAPFFAFFSVGLVIPAVPVPLSLSLYFVITTVPVPVRLLMVPL